MNEWKGIPREIQMPLSPRERKYKVKYGEKALKRIKALGAKIY